MTLDDDAFAHHPELRGKIDDPMTSFMRGISVDMLLELHPELEGAREWTHSDEEREATRKEALTGREGQDLWIFAYGSLMWDPAIRFSEIRRVTVDGYGRRFILLDNKGGRGCEQAPGLMAALDHGPGCEGLAFRVAAPDVEAETEILWRREMIGPGYEPRFVMANLDGTDVEMLTFVADHQTDTMCGDLTWKDQVRFIATGYGFLGTSRDYLEKIVSQLELLNISDPDCERLWKDVQGYLASSGTEIELEPAR